MTSSATPNFDPSHFMPGLSIDCVVFGFDQGMLHVLVLRTKGFDAWALPGGFILEQEDIDA